MTGEAHHRINWASATITVDGLTGVVYAGLGYVGARLVVGHLGDEWRARVFDTNGGLLFNEVALSSTKTERGMAVVTFDDGTTWSVERDGDCGCGN